MIRIAQDETKRVVLTLKEKSELDVPFYIFEVTSIENRDVTLFTGEDTSLNKDRYNSFTFSEGVTATFSSGFDLDVGNYNYKVYETPTELSIDTSTASVVEIGLMEIYSTASSTDVYYDSGDDIEYSYRG